MRTILAAVLLALIAGCGKPYQPVQRETPVESADRGGPGPSATNAPAGKAGLPQLGGELDLAAIRLIAPDSWSRKEPRSSFVLAEFSLPRAEGDEQDGRVTVSVAGGGIQENIDRWRGQFGDKPEKADQKEIQIAGVAVHTVDFSGTFLDQPGPFAPGVQRQGYRMLAAIIPVGEQLHFVKGYGPEKTMAQHAEAFQDFLRTLQVK